MKSRQEIISKIQSILNLQAGTTFDGEASTAAHMIDKLCKEYNLTIEDALEVQALDEQFVTFKRMNVAYVTLLNAVATFYDAKLYIKTDYDGAKALQIIGSEGQQIQVKLYFDYLLQVMEKECDVAHSEEKVIAELTGGKVSRGFKINFRKAFADKVGQRLREMKIEEGRVHEDANAVKSKLALMKLTTGKHYAGAKGDGAYAGAGIGSSVSLNRQASGSTQRALCGV
jgi:hypothetical protein